MDRELIIILGATPASEALIATLNRYGHQLTLIDQNENKLQKINARYDINTICEHPSHPKTLELADTQSANALIALTQSDEINLIACHVAKSLCKDIHCITSLQSHHYFWKKPTPSYAAPIESALSSNAAIFDDIKRLIQHPGYQHINKLGDSCVAASLAISGQSPLAGLTLDEANKILPKKIVMAGLYRQGRWVKFRRNIKLTVADNVLLVSTVDALSSRLISTSQKRHLILMGISALTQQICESSMHRSITVIDPSSDLCQSFAMSYPEVTVLNDDPLDRALLESLGTEHAIVIACSSDDEDNLIYSYQAKDANAYKVFTLLNRIREGHIFEKGPIDYTINAPQIICDEIIRDLLKTRNIVNFYTKQNYLQIASLNIPKSHSYCGMTIAEISLPSDAFIGCIIRNKQPLFTGSTTQILENDKVVIYSNHTKHSDNTLESTFLSPKYLFCE